MEKSKPRFCGGCGKELKFLSILSPVLENNLWGKVLGFFSLSEQRQDAEYPAKEPQYICFECMEKALGRKLLLQDLKQLPFNLYFQLHYFYNVPFDSVKHIQKIMAHYVMNSPKYTSSKLQNEVDFMNGVLMPFTHPECNGYIKSLLFALTDEQLLEELKRRNKERHSQFPPNIRCRDCKHCTDGLTFRHQVIPTTICKMKPKPTQGPDRFYSTVCSHRACEKYEPK